MKAWFGALAMLAALAVGPHPANAAPGGFGAWLQAQDQRQTRKSMQPAPRDQRRENQQAPQRDQRTDSRLTDKERRELRRDVDQADRDIYRQQRTR